ncbi:hypothetical protein ZWY2020_005337 [Hordeum vulgare]|nr:hypothetical protein ZWY2020_005337 [Hordeum vulgare]
MGPKRQYDDLAQPSKAGRSGDGGGGGPSKAPRLSPAPPPPPPAQSHSRDQTALPSSLPPLQPPLVDKDAVGLEEGEIENDADKDSQGKLGVSLPELSLGQLLVGETYVRSPKDHGVLTGGLRCPDAYPKILGRQEQLSELVRESPDNSIIQEKMKILNKHYVRFRRTLRDGSCFYRAFIFSYMEILRHLQDKQDEVTRLMECLDISKDRFSRLRWHKADFSIDPQNYFSRVVSELEEVINVIAAGCTSEWLYQRSLQESFSGRVIPLLRLLTETEIRTEKFYRQYIPENLSVREFCRKTVRSLDAEASTIQMRALTFALGIPLRVEVVDNSLTDQGVLVKRLDFFHETDWDKGPLRLTQGYLSSSTAPIQLKQGSYNADLLSPDGTPMLTLLCRRDQCDILYRN